MSPEEQAAIGAYKDYVRENLPPHNSLADLWYPDFDDKPDIHLLERYVKKLEKYARKLETAASLRQLHYEKFVTDEDPGHKHWRLGMIAVASDCKLKLLKYKGLLEQVTAETFAQCYHYERTPPPCDLSITPDIPVDSIRKPIACTLREVKLRNREKKKQLRKRRALTSKFEDAQIEQYSLPRYSFLMEATVVDMPSADWVNMIHVDTPGGYPALDGDYNLVLDYIMNLIITKIDKFKTEVAEHIRLGYRIHVFSAMLINLLSDSDFISKITLSRPDDPLRYRAHMKYIEANIDRLREYFSYPHFLLYYGLTSTVLSKNELLQQTPVSLLGLISNHWLDAGCIARIAITVQVLNWNTDNGEFLIAFDNRSGLKYWNADIVKLPMLRPVSKYYLKIYNDISDKYISAVATARKNLFAI
jgi:hypothetical protein